MGEGLQGLFSEAMFIPSTPEVGSSVSSVCVLGRGSVSGGSRVPIHTISPDSANTVIVPKGQDHREWVCLQQQWL